MARSFFPTSDASLSVWATNYKETIGDYATEFNLTPQQVEDEKALCDDLIAAVNDVNNKRTLLKSAINGRNEIIATKGGALRAEINRHKAASNYSVAIGENLGIVAKSPVVDYANYKAKITVELFGGKIRIKFKKLQADGINLYRRQKGSNDWAFLVRATKNPYDHQYTLQVNGQPEHWEYRAFGVVDDTEVGIPSDIVEVIYGF